MIYVFGYGSLMNLDSVRTTSVSAGAGEWCTLFGYQRKCNAIHPDFPDVAMNLVVNQSSSVIGRIILFPEIDLPALLQREVGYEMVAITKKLDQSFPQPVYTFIAPDRPTQQGKFVRKAYLDICLDALPESQREQWLSETIIEYPVREI